MDRPCMGTRKSLVNRLGRALKTRSCYGLHTWIGHAWEVFDWWTSALVTDSYSLKTRSCSRLHPWMVHTWEVLDWWKKEKKVLLNNYCTASTDAAGPPRVCNLIKLSIVTIFFALRAWLGGPYLKNWLQYFSKRRKEIIEISWWLVINRKKVGSSHKILLGFFYE